MLRHLVFWQHIRKYKCLPNRHFKEKQVHLHFRCKILSSGWWSELITFICWVPTTYLQGSLLGCWAPQSTALSLALTGKSHQVWKLGVLCIGIKKKKVTFLQWEKSAFSEFILIALSLEERRGGQIRWKEDIYKALMLYVPKCGITWKLIWL